MTSNDVFVIGAGPAGLTAAYLLTKEGVPTTVIEMDERYVGGISRTESYKGFLFDIGGHRFFSKSKEVVDLWNEILPDDFIERPRLSRIYYNGRYFSYPLKAFEALNNLGYLESALCVLSYLHKQVFPHDHPETFHQWVSNQFGERLFSIFFKTYTEKVWGMSCDEISADWAAQRIKGLDLWSAMANALRRSMRPQTQGVGGRWTAIARRADGSHATFSADHVISSAPIRELCRTLDPLPDCVSAADALRYRDFLTVALMVKKPDLFPDNWIYIHEPSVKVGRTRTSARGRRR